MAKADEDFAHTQKKVSDKAAAKEIKAAENPVEVLQSKIDEYTVKFANPYQAAGRGYIDEVIYPHNSRKKLISAFTMLENKVDKIPKKKHGNIPL